jgi:hypothetical protein
VVAEYSLIFSNCRPNFNSFGARALGGVLYLLPALNSPAPRMFWPGFSWLNQKFHKPLVVAMEMPEIS